MEAEAGGRGAGKLIRGARLLLFSPEWARPCSLCVKYVFDADGNVKRLGNGAPMERPHGAPTPCDKCPKVPTWAKKDGSRTALELRNLADEIGPESRKAINRFVEFRATGRFPDDPLVTWAAGALAPVWDEWQREPAELAAEATMRLCRILTAKAKR